MDQYETTLPQEIDIEVLQHRDDVLGTRMAVQDRPVEKRRDEDIENAQSQPVPVVDLRVQIVMLFTHLLIEGLF